MNNSPSLTVKNRDLVITANQKSQEELSKNFIKDRRYALDNNLSLGRVNLLHNLLLILGLLQTTTGPSPLAHYKRN